MTKIRVFEAFAGIGTQAMALKKAGIDFETVAISEISTHSVLAYEAIHGAVNNLGDVSKIDVTDIPDHDLFTYSFPCQDISTAGKQLGLEEGAGTRSSLLWECKKIINHVKPKYLVMENVKNLLNKNNMPHFLKWVEWLESLGYSNTFGVLNAKEFGVPQNRERVFLISKLGEHELKMPQPLNTPTSLASILQPDAEVQAFYMSDELQDRFQLNLQNDELMAKVASGRKSYTVVGTLQNASAKGLNMGAWVYDYNTPIMSCLLARDYKQPKMITMDATTPLEEQLVRKLTPLEYWRLMGIDDQDYYSAVNAGLSKTKLYEMAGNSIVVPVLSELFKELID